MLDWIQTIYVKNTDKSLTMLNIFQMLDWIDNICRKQFTDKSLTMLNKAEKLEQMEAMIVKCC